MTFPHPFQEVRRVEGVKLADVHTSFEHDEPILYVNAIGHLPFLQELNQCGTESEKLAFLARTFGQREIAIDLQHTKGRALGEQRSVKMAFSAFIEMVSQQLGKPADEVAYMANQPVAKFPELGWKPEELAQHKTWTQGVSGFWIGAGGHTTNFHMDNATNFISMFAGTKRVALLPYPVLLDMYPVLDPEKMVTYSSVRLLEPDFAKFPRYREALKHLRVVEVKPGDSLLVPPHWWHHVDSFGLNIMVNMWSMPMTLEKWSELGRTRAKATLLFRDFPEAWRDYYAAHWDARVFRDGSTPPAQPPAGDPPTGRDAAEANLADAIAQWGEAPATWRRHGQLSFRHFVFHKFGHPMSHAPGAYDMFIKFITTRLQSGERLSPIG